MPEQNTTPSDNSPDTSQFTADFSTVLSIFVRQRNCLLLKADFSPLFVGYYLHLMQHGMHNAPIEDSLFKDLLAYFTLHLVSRPWKEHHAWTFNIKSPSLANYFITGSSLTEDAVGRVFTDDVREPDTNILYAQNISRNRDTQTSVIPLAGDTASAWVEEFYRQSEQRPARAFHCGEDTYALIVAEPGADFDWLNELTTDDVVHMTEHEQLKQLETRRFTFRCGCTAERILPTIRAMQKDFADIISEQGKLEVSCPRCGAIYIITPDMLSRESDLPDSHV